MRRIALLLILCLPVLFGCAYQQLENSEKDGTAYTVRRPYLLGFIPMPKQYNEIKTPWEEVQDRLATAAFWMMIGGIVVAVGCLGVHIGMQNPLVQGWCKIGCAAGVTSLVAGMILLAVATWMTWLLLIVVVVGATYYMRKTKDHGIDVPLGRLFGGLTDKMKGPSNV